APVSRRLLLRAPSGLPCDLHSFPTRRSSDLRVALPQDRAEPDGDRVLGSGSSRVISSISSAPAPDRRTRPGTASPCARICTRHRSEEHTSELQSRFDLVCRLLLEKKKADSSA